MHAYGVIITENESDPSKGGGSDNMPPEVINVRVYHMNAHTYKRQVYAKIIST